MMQARWTPDEDTRLRAAWQPGACLNDIVTEIGRSRGSLIHRARQLHLPNVGLDRQNNYLDGDPDTIGMDICFVAAMMKAIEDGKECPPVGVDTRPCTRRPQFIPHGDRDASSFMGSAADI